MPALKAGQWAIGNEAASSQAFLCGPKCPARAASAMRAVVHFVAVGAVSAQRMWAVSRAEPALFPPAYAPFSASIFIEYNFALAALMVLVHSICLHASIPDACLPVVDA